MAVDRKLMALVSFFKCLFLGSIAATEASDGNFILMIEILQHI